MALASGNCGAVLYVFLSSGMALWEEGGAVINSMFLFP
jgi:hypothetical protein